MKIGICGLGFVGNAIYTFMKNQHEIVIYDKYKQLNTLDILLDAEIIYLCVPTPYNDTIKTYSMDELDNTFFLLAELNYKGIILVKSTVLPDYCETMNNTYPGLHIIHNPEFLSAKTAEEDFKEQKHIILGYTMQSQPHMNRIETYYKNIIPASTISVTTSTASALVKLACNSFYATKVQYFTELFLLCEKINVDFNTVKHLMLNNNWINPMHTQVPGQDGDISFGGACLPKDISALNQYMIVNNVPNRLVNSVISERNIMRE